MEEMIIVGCDIRAYTRLPPDDQIDLTTHLASCHTETHKNLRLHAAGFSDTGDGFYVAFEKSQKNEADVLKYLGELCDAYYEPRRNSLKETVKSHWLKVAAGVGMVDVAKDDGKIRGNGINMLSRILDQTRTGVPLVMTGSHQLMGATDASIRLFSKHGAEKAGDSSITYEPFLPEAALEGRTGFLGLIDAANAELLRSKNPFFFVKHVAIEGLEREGERREEGRARFWRYYNGYIRFRRLAELLFPEEDADPDQGASAAAAAEEPHRGVIIEGHSLEPCPTTLEEIAKDCESSGRLEYDVDLVMLDPDSPDAASRREEKNRLIRMKIISTLERIRDLVKRHPFMGEVSIHFTDRMIDKGVFKIFDLMDSYDYRYSYLLGLAQHDFIGMSNSSPEKERFLSHVQTRFRDLVRDGAAGRPREHRTISVRSFKASALPRLVEALRLADSVAEATGERIDPGYARFLPQDFLVWLARPTGEWEGCRQVELHPGAACGMSCSFCEGGRLPRSAATLGLPSYEAFFRDLGPADLGQVIVSGQNTEPLAYPELPGLLSLVSAKGIPVGLYTNGHIPLDAALASLGGSGNYIVINAPGLSEIALEASRNQRGLKEELGRLERNLVEICAAREKGILGRARINYELNEHNYIDTSVRDFLERLGDALGERRGLIEVRISMPIAKARSGDDAIDEAESSAYVEHSRIWHSTVSRFAQGAEGLSAGVPTAFSIVPRAHNSFSACYAMYDSIVIASDGKAYPCCYTANAAIGGGLCYGEIGQGFRALKAVRRAAFETMRAAVPSRLCPACSNKDHLINTLAAASLYASTR